MANNASVVSIEQGQLKGKIALDYCGEKYFSFQGIPYAKPPLGNLRFKVISLVFHLF